jgi:tetratricopeptide (TPR) repeat protein
MRWLTCLLFCGAVASPLGAEHAEALALFEQKRYAEAQALFEQEIADNPDDGTAHYYLGRLARLRQQLPTAIEHLEKATAVEPENAAYQYEFGAACGLHADTLGMSFRAASFARQGRAALEKAVALAPDQLRYRRGLLEFHRTAPGIVGGSIAKAYEQAEAIRALDPLAGALELIALYRHQKRHADAFAAASALVAEHPDHPMALFRFGEAAAVTGQETAKGMAALERCLTLLNPEAGPSPAHVHWRLGQLRQKQGDIEGARSAFRAALAIEPNQQEMAADLARLPREGAP